VWLKNLIFVSAGLGVTILDATRFAVLPGPDGVAAGEKAQRFLQRIAVTLRSLGIDEYTVGLLGHHGDRAIGINLEQRHHALDIEVTGVRSHKDSPFGVGLHGGDAQAPTGAGEPLFLGVRIDAS
jgi:hypothetical protein